MKINKNRFSGLLGLLLVALMLIFEARYYTIKVIILLLLTLIFIGSFRVEKPVLKVYFALCISSILGAIVGVTMSTLYPFSTLTIGVVWPTLSLIIAIPLLKTEENFLVLIKWLFFIHSFLVIYDLSFSMSVIWGFSFPNIYPEIETPFSFYGFTSRMNFYNLNVLTFTTPIFFMIWLSKYDIRINRVIQTIVLTLSFFLLIFSGRRSLMLIFVLAPLLTMMIGGVLPRHVVKKTKKYLIIFIVFIAGVLVYTYMNYIDIFQGYLYTFTKAFDSNEEPTKFVQADLLLQTFKENPIFGAGSGVQLYETARGIWKYQFELTYLHKLATGGVIGFTLYIIGVVGPFLIGLKYAKKHKDQLFVFVLVGYFFVLIADATNPVLCSFDLMLPLYLCYAKINSHALIEKNNLNF